MKFIYFENAFEGINNFTILCIILRSYQISRFYDFTATSGEAMGTVIASAKLTGVRKDFVLP